ELARGELDEIRQDVGGKAIDRCRRLRLAHAAEHEPAHEIRAAARRHLLLQLLAYVLRRARYRDASVARLVEVAGEADREGAEITPELGQVRVPRGIGGAGQRLRLRVRVPHHYVPADAELGHERAAVGA